MDKLNEIYDMQTKLDERIISERNIELTTDEWVRNLTIAMESEIDEIRREINWKWWKNPKEIDQAALQGEVIDMWHFLLSLSRVVGLSADDIHRLYLEKNAENHARQDGTSSKEGYEVERKPKVGEIVVLTRQYATRNLTEGYEYVVLEVGESHIGVYGNNYDKMAIAHGHYKIKEDGLKWRKLK
jgi:dimeric dUTPase (all-alpha-NTP-PPase superfamily)